MTYLEWSDSMSVHVDEIDNDHRQFVDLLSRLGDAMLHHRGHRRQRVAISVMLDYAEKHFAREEQLMGAFEFDGLAAHHAEHEQFLGKARELKERSDRGGFILTLEIVDYLKTWLVDHVMGTDQRYVELFREHGLK